MKTNFTPLPGRADQLVLGGLGTMGRTNMKFLGQCQCKPSNRFYTMNDLGNW